MKLLKNLFKKSIVKAEHIPRTGENGIFKQTNKQTKINASSGKKGHTPST